MTRLTTSAATRATKEPRLPRNEKAGGEASRTRLADRAEGRDLVGGPVGDEHRAQHRRTGLEARGADEDKAEHQAAAENIEFPGVRQCQEDDGTEQGDQHHGSEQRVDHRRAVLRVRQVTRQGISDPELRDGRDERGGGNGGSRYPYVSHGKHVRKQHERAVSAQRADSEVNKQERRVLKEALREKAARQGKKEMQTHHGSSVGHPPAPSTSICLISASLAARPARRARNNEIHHKVTK